MTRAQQARENFLGGMNCSQAIVLAFSDILDVPREKLLALALPLGGGLGRLRLTCGAVSGGAVVLGLRFPALAKQEMYEAVQEYARRVQGRCGSICCGDLLRAAGLPADTVPHPEERTPEYYRRRPCPQILYDAADILDHLMQELEERG